MRAAEKTRKEIEDKIAKMGDYVKIGYLSTCLKNNLDFDTRRFVLVTLSKLYESKKMFSDAGKAMKTAADINTTDQGKINDFVKTAELFIQGGSYDDAELTSKKALGIANTKQKDEIKKAIKETYKSQSKFFMEKDKRKQAVEIYERLLTIELDENEKKEIRSKLLVLYENLGKIREYYDLKQKIEYKKEESYK